MPSRPGRPPWPLMANWPGRRSLSLPCAIRVELESLHLLFCIRLNPASLHPRARAAAQGISGRRPLLATEASRRRWSTPNSLSLLLLHVQCSLELSIVTQDCPPSPLDRAADGAPPSPSTSGHRRRSPPPPLPQRPSCLQLVAVVVSKTPCLHLLYPEP
jgi:hypothetical protein